MNQDALENYFGCIRSCCHSSCVIPTHFRAAYVTTFVNNLSSAHSIKSNCEPDVSVPLLTEVHRIFLNYDIVEDVDDSDHSDAEEDDQLIFDPLHNFSNTKIKESSNEAVSNICDSLLKTIKCKNCRKMLETSSILNDHDILDVPKHPSGIFNNNFKKILSGISDVLPTICAEKFLKRKLLQELDKIEIDKMGCFKHCDEVETKFKEQTAVSQIVAFTKNVNDLLSGKKNTLTHQANCVEQLAFQFNQKKKNIGKHSDIFKKN